MTFSQKPLISAQAGIFGLQLLSLFEPHFLVKYNGRENLSPPCLSSVSLLRASPPCLSSVSLLRASPPCLSSMSLLRVSPPCLSWWRYFSISLLTGVFTKRSRLGHKSWWASDSKKREKLSFSFCCCCSFEVFSSFSFFLSFNFFIFCDPVFFLCFTLKKKENECVFHVVICRRFWVPDVQRVNMDLNMNLNMNVIVNMNLNMNLNMNVIVNMNLNMNLNMNVILHSWFFIVKQ